MFILLLVIPPNTLPKSKQIAVTIIRPLNPNKPKNWLLYIQVNPVDARIRARKSKLKNNFYNKMSFYYNQIEIIRINSNKEPPYFLLYIITVY